MSYNNKEKGAILKVLVKPYYRFPGRDDIDQQMEDVITHYFARLEIGERFEARGLLVTAESRSGKTDEISA